jgi:uncharacterized peroxidase-related enzyme
VQVADALMKDYRTAPIEPEMKQLLSFAEKIARDASQITSEDIERIRFAGFSDRAILDAAHVTGFFSYMNRVVQALGADNKSATLTQAISRCGNLPNRSVFRWSS